MDNLIIELSLNFGYIVLDVIMDDCSILIVAVLVVNWFIYAYNSSVKEYINLYAGFEPDSELRWACVDEYIQVWHYLSKIWAGKQYSIFCEFSDIINHQNNKVK